VRTVLVVEDEWAIADWISAVLDDEGYTVIVATNGRRALELLKEQTPDLVLTDFMMPIVDGPGLLQAMRRSGLATTPVIMMSSLPEAVVAEKCDGHSAFLRKPFRIAELLRAVRGALGEAGAPGSHRR
jgi:CheY-like chemotaxis protein